MADSSLRDVIKSIKVEGAERANADERTHELLLAIDKRFADYFEELRRGKLDALEDRLEKKKNKAKAGTSKPGKGPEADLGFLSGLGLGALGTALSSLAGIAGTFAGLTGGFVAATEGLGVYKADLEKFKTAMKAFMKPLNALTRLVDNTAASLLRGLGLLDDADAGDPRKGASKTLADKARARWEKFKSRLLLTLGIGEDGEVIQRKQKAYPNLAGKKSKLGEIVKKVLDQLDDVFGKIKDTAKGITGYFEKGQPGAKILETLKNFKPLVIAEKILRPLAAIFAIFDGFRVAEEEMGKETLDGYFEKYVGAGLGGFVAGFVKSFFGEFFDLIKAIPLFIIKKVVPDDWLEKTEDGSVKFNPDENILTSILAGFDEFSFATLLKDVVLKPFMLIGAGLDYISDLLGFNGDDRKEKVRSEFANWWQTTSWGQKGLDIASAIINIVFSPITSIISEIEASFMGKDRDDVYGESFVDKITKFVTWFSEWLDNLIPDKEDLLRGIANKLPENVARALDLGEYLQSNSERIQSKEEELAKLYDTYKFNMEKGGYGLDIAKTIISPIMDAQKELNELRKQEGMNPIQIFNTDNSQTNNGGGTAVVVEGTFSSADIANQLRATGILGANP